MSSPDLIELARMLNGSDRTPRDDLARLQQRRLDALVDHARERSPYYRDTLPTLDKATLTERFEDIACDPRLAAPRWTHT